jgi:CBS domain-containing protein
MLSGHVAREVLQSDSPRVSPALTLDHLINEYIFRTGRRCFPVVEGDRLLGIVTLHHVKGTPRDAWAMTRVDEVMTPLERTVKVGPEETLARVLEQMTADRVNQVLVVQDERLLGLVSREQLLEFIKTRAELGV